jgi:hypothetical protein
LVAVPVSYALRGFQYTREYLLDRIIQIHRTVERISTATGDTAWSSRVPENYESCVTGSRAVHHLNTNRKAKPMRKANIARVAAAAVTLATITTLTACGADGATKSETETETETKTESSGASMNTSADNVPTDDECDIYTPADVSKASSERIGATLKVTASTELPLDSRIDGIDMLVGENILVMAGRQLVAVDADLKPGPITVFNADGLSRYSTEEFINSRLDSYRVYVNGEHRAMKARAITRGGPDSPIWINPSSTNTVHRVTVVDPACVED